MFTLRNVTWTGLIWGDYKKTDPKDCFHKTVVVLDSDKEDDNKRLLNVQGPSNVYNNVLINERNTKARDASTINLGREIRDDLDRFDSTLTNNIENTSLQTPRNANQIGNAETPNADSEEMNDEESRIISVHSTDSSYAPSDTPIF